MSESGSESETDNNDDNSDLRESDDSDDDTSTFLGAVNDSKEIKNTKSCPRCEAREESEKT